MDVLRLRWNGTELVDITGAPEIPLYVADSFLLNDGKVVGFQRHLERFTTSAHRQGLVRSVDAFLETVTSALPREGAWFPRIDLTERGELEVWIRPAPPLKDTIVLSTSVTDPRKEPAIKGPDIPALNEIRAHAQKQGAEDAVILDSLGRIVDGSTTCLVWVEGETVLMPPLEALRVDSVTVSVLRDILRGQGIEVEERWATPADIEGCELYALNALHGIRSALSWVNGPTLRVNHERLNVWRNFYAGQTEKLPVTS
ncbi:hypothetical protein AINA4_09680 [Aurantimicrobium sp. INA4]|uniref:aminotransferase class IV n=1 Tax=Aurantimicrobium sp. INA4 TaxID=2986279 RepID=UPI002491F6C8|nr:aminotransferase class IV [Aurantimicrobium sp. INA4]BDU11047.1 hypothetical protein AINA4_09680 [Aurantimicrobium sp. INA4]